MNEFIDIGNPSYDHYKVNDIDAFLDCKLNNSRTRYFHYKKGTKGGNKVENIIRGRL